MYSLTADDLTNARKRLEEVNGGQGPASGTPLHALAASTAALPDVKALGQAALFGVLSGGDTITPAIAIGIVIGFQAGLTRAVDEPVKALVESVNVPTAAA